MKRKLLSLLCAAALALTAGCGASNTQDTPEGTLRVLATTYPVYLFTTAVTEGVEGVEVSLLVNQETSCLHDYTLTVNDMKAIEKADVIVKNGAGFEAFMDDALSHSSAAVIDCSQGLELLAARGHDHDHDSTSETDGEHFDPHFWLDPICAVQMMSTISMSLNEIVYGDDAANHGEFHTAYLNAVQTLEMARQQWEPLLPAVSGAPLITFHDGFQYFAAAFDLELLCSIEEEEGSEASAADIREIVALVEEHGIPAIFTEKNGSDSTALAIARETGCAVGELNLLMSGEGQGLDPYIEAMNQNIHAILEAFQ